MTHLGKWQALELAVCLAIMLHLLLFLIVRSPDRDSLAGTLVPPQTHYLGTASSRSSLSGINARTVWSPVIFSLPSEMGFSRDLLQDDLRTRLIFSKPKASENFLEVDLASGETGTQIDPRKLLVTEAARSTYQLPSDVFIPGQERPAANRIYVNPELKERLVGGVVLPPALNKASAASWEVRANISISKQGQVQHVLLEKPLESLRLNQEVIRLLHGLHFQSGEKSVEGYIEIYSPRSDPTTGAVQ